VSKILKLVIKVSDGMAENIAADLAHMSTPHGRLSWIRMPIEGASLVSWEVGDVARPDGSEGAGEGKV
jgi:hypothetical protein